MLSRPCKPHPTLGPWIVFGEFYPALTIRHDDSVGEESYNFSIKLKIRWWIPWPGHSRHLTSWSWQWHPSRDPGPDMSIQNMSYKSIYLWPSSDSILEKYKRFMERNWKWTVGKFSVFSAWCNHALGGALALKKVNCASLPLSKDTTPT